MNETVFLSSGIQLCYETLGQVGNPPVLLNMGNSCDGTLWPGEFCKALADRGFFVVRFDQRDTGLSSWIDFAEAPYDLMDMVKDILGLLDHLKLKKAHIVGYSTGGLISQLLAIHYPERLLSLTLMMTSTNLTIKNDAFLGMDMTKSPLPPPKPEFIQGVLALHSRPQSTVEEKTSFLVENFRLANGFKSSFDPNYFHEVFKRSLKRVDGKLGKGGHESNHALATSRTPVIQNQEFVRITARTLIISGTEDPVFPPGHGESLASAIPGSKLLNIEGMGHVLNPVFFNVLVQTMTENWLASA